MNQIDFRRLPNLNEEEKKLVAVMLRMRAIAGAALIGVVALVAVTGSFGPSGDSVTSVPGAARQSGAPVDAGLMALEHGRIG